LAYSLYLTMFDYSLGLEPQFVGLANYIAFSTDPAFWYAANVTFIYSFAGVTIQLIAGLGIALLLSRQMKGASIVKTIIVCPLMMAPVTIGYLWRLLVMPQYGALAYTLDIIGFKDPHLLVPPFVLWVIILAESWQWTPFVALCLLAGILSLPSDMIEAAEVDGVSRAQKLRYIVLPSLRNVITIVFLIRLIDLLKGFDTIYTISTGGPGLATSTISFIAYIMWVFLLKFGNATTYAWLLVIIVNIVVIVFSRVFFGRRS